MPVPGQQSPRKIAIIGGGASGALVCAHLLRHSRAESLAIEWIERSGNFGPGIPYSSRDPEHRLNVRASGMSAFQDTPTHFLDWAKIRDPGAKAEDFLPRRRFGEYLSELVPVNHPKVRKHYGEAVEIDLTPTGVKIRLDDGQQIDADEVVLAIGILKQKSGFGAENPWSAAWLRDTLPANSTVLAIGTGLTLVDLALSLCTEPNGPKIIAVSRRGLLPRAHSVYKPHSPSPEFQAWLAERPPSSARGLGIFRAECEIAEKNGSSWRAVFDLLRPATPAFWSGLPEKEKRRFLRHLVRFWDVHRHRMAPEIAAKIEELRENGRLAIYPGRIRELSWDGKRWNLDFTQKDGKALRTGFDHAFDCTGYSQRVQETSSRLFQDLLKKGVLSVDEPPIGAHLASRASHVHLIGPILRGTYWESVAIPEIRVRAREIATQILG